MGNHYWVYLDNPRKGHQKLEVNWQMMMMMMIIAQDMEINGGTAPFLCDHNFLKKNLLVNFIEQKEPSNYNQIKQSK